MQIPENWSSTTLGEVITPTQKRVDPQDYPDLRYIGLENIEAHTMKLLKTIPSIEMRSSSDSFEEGDVLYGGLRPYLNKVHVVDFKGLCSGEFIIFRKTPGVHSKYLAYFLNSTEFVKYANSLNTGDRPRVKFKQFADYPFPLPPLPEQERIVERIESLFSRLDAGVAAFKRAQAALKRYRASVLKAACEGRLVPQDPNDEPAAELLKRILAEKGAKVGDLPEGLPDLPVGWCWARIRDLSKAIQYGTSEKTDQVESGITVLRMGNIQDGQLDFSNLKYLSENTKGLESLILDQGDLLFNRTNSAELVGKSAIYKEFHPRATFASYLIRVKFHDVIQSDYVAYFINSVYGREYIKSVVSQQVGQANVNGTKLANMPISLPPAKEQHQIVSQVERFFSVIQEMDNSISIDLTRAARLRQSILKRAFEGRLVQDSGAR